MSLRTLIFALLLSYTNNGFACDCPNKPSLDSAVKNSTFVFSGMMSAQTKIKILMQDTIWTFVDSPTINEPFVLDYIKYTFTIEKKYKGIKNKKTIDVYSPAGSTSCGFQFQQGQVYIIYGDPIIFSQSNGAKTKGVHTTTCDRTDRFSKSEGKHICRVLKTSTLL